MVGGITSTTDGGSIMLLHTFSDELQWKADATGEPLWCNRYSVSGQNMAPMPDGGVVFGELGTYEHGFDTDTSLIHYKIVRTDTSGDVEWSKLLTLHFLFPSKGPLPPTVLASDANGNILITVPFDAVNATEFWFVSLNASGVVLWSNLYMVNMPVVAVSALASDGNSGWFFAYNEAPIHNTFRMGHLFSEGEVAWFKSYQYNYFIAEVRMGGLTTVNGQAAVGGGLSTDVIGERGFVMKANFDGSIAWYTTYGTTEFLTMFGFTRIGSLPNGELIASSGYPGWSNAIDVIHTASDGSILNSIRPDSIIDTQFIHEGRWWDLDLDDTALTFSGYLIETDLMLGTQTYRPSIWKLSPSQLAGCLTTPEDVVSIPIPQVDVQAQALPLDATPALVTIVDSSITVVPVPLIGTHDYCSFITAVPTVGSVTDGLHVRCSIVQQGDVIIATSSCDGMVQAFDVRGRIAGAAQMSARSETALGTTAWQSGFYLLRATDAIGHVVGTTKVMLE